ncbi:hypothetical protein P2G82_13605 [Citrobacter braakii]|uniref:hypothetical protein n=1 Tax=Enterobacteriaceae TaxID=543 RepID=UPI001F17A129|nr:hypothetical protein [Citrobacter braakii]MCF2474810.1 hypothetical protein [Citrobacter braakii]MDK2365230.1 hypothetical protein [Citrobacter braakii]
MMERITFSITNSETLRVLDEYSRTQKISRSQVITTLLDATVPVLNDVNRYYQLADELKSRLLAGVYQQDLPRRRNVVMAEKYCLEIWESKLQVRKVYDFDSVNGVMHVRERKRHYRQDKAVGRVENRYINDLCQSFLDMTDLAAQYACFIYTDRIIFTDEGSKEEDSSPLKLAAGDAVILMAKDVIYNEYFFDLKNALFINVIDLMSFGSNGIPETTKDPRIHCWVPILFSGKNAVIVPVYRIDPHTAPTLRKPDKITVIYSGKK